jgi:hypothetical protein
MFKKFPDPGADPGSHIKAKPDLARPSLAGLIYALRNLGEVLPDFEWNYRDCRTCAMGVAHDLWDIRSCSADLSEALNIPDVAAFRIFLNADGRHGAIPTAAMVADDLAALRRVMTGPRARSSAPRSLDL